MDAKGKIKPQTMSVQGEEVHVILSASGKWDSGMRFAKLCFPRKGKKNRYRAVCCKVLVKERRSKDECCKTVLLKEVAS